MSDDCSTSQILLAGPTASILTLGVNVTPEGVVPDTVITALFASPATRQVALYRPLLEGTDAQLLITVRMEGDHYPLAILERIAERLPELDVTYDFRTEGEMALLEVIEWKDGKPVFASGLIERRSSEFGAEDWAQRNPPEVVERVRAVRQHLRDIRERALRAAERAGKPVLSIPHLTSSRRVAGPHYCGPAP